MTIRNVSLTLILFLALGLAALVAWAASPASTSFAGSSTVVVPDIGAAPTHGPALAGSSTVVVPDIGAAPAATDFLAGSSTVVVPDVG